MSFKAKQERACIDPTKIQLISVQQGADSFFRACAVGLSIRLQEVFRTTMGGMTGIPMHPNTGIDEQTYKAEVQICAMLRHQACDFIGKPGNQEYFDTRLNYLTKPTENPDIDIPYWQTDIGKKPFVKDLNARARLLRDDKQPVGLLEIDAMASALKKPIWIIGYSKKHNNRLTLMYEGTPKEYSPSAPLKVYYEYARSGDKFSAVQQIVSRDDRKHWNVDLRIGLEALDFESPNSKKDPYAKCGAHS